MGLEQPKAAFWAANEKFDPKMPSPVDAQVLGASRPVILTSRDEPPMGKMAFVALAAYSVARNS